MEEKLLAIGSTEFQENLTWFNTTKRIGGQMIKFDETNFTYVTCPVCGKRNYVTVAKRQRFTCPHCATRVNITRFKFHVKFYRPAPLKSCFVVKKNGLLIVDRATDKPVLSYLDYKKMPEGALETIIALFNRKD